MTSTGAAKLSQRIAFKALMIDRHRRLLLLRKGQDNVRHAGHSGRYNLPGGKLNLGEHPDDGLRREVHEETGLTIDEIGPPVGVAEWRPVIGEVSYQIIGVFVSCYTWNGELVLGDEHDGYVWAGPDELDTLDIISTEREVIDRYYRDHGLTR